MKYNYDISHKSIGRAELLFNQVMAYVPKKELDLIVNGLEQALRLNR